MPDLKLQNIAKVFPGGVQAVYDFSIEIKQGEFIVLVGPSGCGKTTVLRMIAGLEMISDGDMYLADKRINDVAPSDRDISMVFQNYALYGHMSAYQNMGFSQTIRHEDPDVIHEKVMETAEIVELKEQLNRIPKNLSGGQRQRVALGRSIVSRTNIILMDEPLSNLDAKLRVQSRRELIKLHQKLGSTFIYVTHDQTEAMTMADRIVVIDNGRIQQIGSPSDVYHWPENIFVGGFIGSPPMNFFAGKIEHNKFVSENISLTIPPKILESIRGFLDDNDKTESIIMGIRPERFSTEPGEGFELITAEVSSSEFLGEHSLVYLRIGGVEYVANLKHNIAQSVGDSIEVYIDMNHVHFFDPITENRIRLEGDLS